MLGWLYRILIGRFTECDHHWVILRRVDIIESDFGDIPYGRRYELQCDKCGWLKSRKFF